MRAIQDIMKNAEGRYLTTDEGKRLLESAREYERLLGITRTLEQRETEIVRQTIDRAMQKFPKFHQERPMAYEKAERDVTLVLRYSALAMLNRDPEMLREKVLYWMRSILKALDFSDVSKYTYETLAEVIQKTLPANDAEEINKYIRIAAEVLA